MIHTIPHRYSITSSAAAAVNGATLNVDGNPFAVQIHIAPAQLVNIQVSDDAVLWVNTIHEAAGAPAASTTLAAGFYPVINRAKYARVQVALDGGGPQVFVAVITVFKET